MLFNIENKNLKFRRLKMSYTENILGMLSSNIDQRNDLIITPVPIAKEMVNILPEEVWNKDTTFLDPACKSGIFLHEIYLKLMETPAMIQEFPDEAERRKHILQNQLFGIALNPMCQLTSARTVYGTIKGENNIKLIDNYITIVKNKDTRFFKEALEKEFNREMKFDVVIGNPPYQEKDNSGLDGGSALYDKFMKIADTISDINCMIVPMRWMVQYRVKGIDSTWVNEQLHCNKYVKLMYNEESRNIFNGVNIRGGIMYYLKDMAFNGMCSVGIIGNNSCINRYLASEGINVFIANNIEEEILAKVHSKTNFDTIVGSCNEFGIESNDVTCGTGIKLYKSFGEIGECSIDEITKGHNFINLYKVIIGRTFGSGKKGERLPVPRVIGPNEICTGSLLMIGKSTDKQLCDNIAKYMQTKLFSLLVGLRKSTHHATKEAYAFVPLQDFTSASDIDWSQSIADIDQQLYKKYNLTQEEINYIEKTIKPMQ